METSFLPQLLATTFLPSVSMICNNFNTVYEYNHIVFVLLCFIFKIEFILFIMEQFQTN